MSTIILALALACADMSAFQATGTGVTITKAEKLSDNLPPRCHVDGVIDKRTGGGGKEYGIGFAVALPDNWNGHFLFQGGGGLNGNVANPAGAQAAGDASALSRGFAIVTTDTGHKGTGGFDGSFMADQQAALDFYYVAIGRVAPLAKEIIARYYSGRRITPTMSAVRPVDVRG
jgi:feruloyl esterase